MVALSRIGDVSFSHLRLEYKLPSSPLVNGPARILVSPSYPGQLQLPAQESGNRPSLELDPPSSLHCAFQSAIHYMLTIPDASLERMDCSAPPRTHSIMYVICVIYESSFSERSTYSYPHHPGNVRSTLLVQFCRRKSYLPIVSPKSGCK